jgi:probable DNA repair protein
MSHRPSAIDAPLAESLRRGDLLLTVNNRLARHLLDAFERQQVAAGRSVWETPDILPLGAWLMRSHDRLLDLGMSDARLLTPAQELVLWERIIAASTRGLPLLRPAAAARSAVEAYRLLQGWQLAGHPELSLSPEGEAFAQWIEGFERLCRQRRLRPAARLSALLTDAIANGRLVLPDTVWLAGFDDHSPAQHSLWDAMREAGSSVLPLEDHAGTAAPTRLICADPAEERRLVARWTLQRLQDDPQARIAIISPDIQGQRESLRQALTDTLVPDSLPPGQSRERLPFNFSLGLPLADQPAVRDALLALELVLGELEHGELNQLLRSPFLAAGLGESQPRALFDAELRRRGFPRYTLHRLRQQAGRITPEGPADCPRLFGVLAQLAESRETQTAKAGPAHWARHFQQLLTLWGWPGERQLSSHEYQQTQAFNGLLGSLAQLEDIAGQTGARLALQRLRQLAQDTLFQPEGSDAPVQVLGVLEAAGQRFDHLWVLGLDDGHWPPVPTPNPLLPSQLQRQLGLPHGSAERELTFARQTLDRLLGAAPEVVLSHAAVSADGEQGPSPLIAELPVTDAAVLGLPDAAATSPGGNPLETLDDWQAPQAPETLPGGTPLLADQAACPFRAFGHHRLLARRLEEVSHGSDPRLIGSQVHRILEQVWRSLGDQQTLLAQSPEQLAELVAQAVRATLEDLGRERPDLYTAAFRELEQARLVELVSYWLDLETRRLPFRVMALEQRSKAQIGPLTLNIQADRVDSLDDGRVVVIDYKTGRSQRTTTWTRERPEEPQVPLYAIQHGAQLAAAAIGRVRLDKDGGFKGLAERDGLLPGIKAFKGSEAVPDWPALTGHWQAQLTALAEEVVGGRADPTPATETCRYCDLATLCRVALMDGSQGGSEDDGGADHD